MALASTLRLFGSTQEHKLNQRSRRRRHVLVKWLFGGYKEFYISYDTVIAGSLDLLMYVLQLASALVSLVLSILRILVMVEALLFLPAKICWELPSPGEHNNLIFGMTYDEERLSMIFGLFDDYFMKVLTTARQSAVQGLEMSLRDYISDMLVESTNNAAACILILETLYEPGEWIKTKGHADKRAKLLPFLFQHIDSSMDHEEQGSCNLTGDPSLALPVAKHLKTCLASANKHEVSLGIDVVRRLPAEFLLSTHMVEEQIKAPLIDQHRHLAAMMVLTLGEHRLQSMTNSVQASRAVDGLLKGTRIRELEILVRLDAIGLISRKQKRRVGIANFFREQNFIRCLPLIIEWVSSMDADMFHEIFDKRLIKFCRLLLRDSFFKSKIEDSPTLGQLLLQSHQFHQRATLHLEMTIITTTVTARGDHGWPGAPSFASHSRILQLKVETTTQESKKRSLLLESVNPRVFCRLKGSSLLP